MLRREELLAAMPALAHADKAALVDRYLPHLAAAMEEFGVTNAARAAAFLAQVGHESLDFRYMEEIASGAAYDHRADLGNTRPEAIAAATAHHTTPGRFYKGHGPIQITGYWNHKAAGEALGVDGVNEPAILATPEHGFRAAGWFWRSKGLNELADRGAFETITRRINGGLNGYADRVARWKRAKAALAVRSSTSTSAVGAAAPPTRPLPLAAGAAATAGAGVASAGAAAASTGHSSLAVALLVLGALVATIGLAWLAYLWLARDKET